MSREKFVRDAFTGLAALSLVAGAEVSAQTIKGSESGQTTNAAAERPWQPSPSVEPAMRAIFDPGVAVEHSENLNNENGSGAGVSFHATDTRGSRALYEVAALISQQGEHGLVIKVCTDPQGDEVGSEVVMCDDDNNDSVTFTDLNADGVLDGVTVHMAHPLVPEDDINVISTSPDWRRSYQDRYTATMDTIARFIANQGRERM